MKRFPRKTQKVSFKNDVNRVGYLKLVTKSDIEGKGYMQIVTSSPKENMDKFLFFACSWSEWQQLSLD